MFIEDHFAGSIQSIKALFRVNLILSDCVDKSLLRYLTFKCPLYTLYLRSPTL